MVSDGASNVWGSAYADTLTGNSGANLLQGNGGNDTLDGGEGSDTAVYNLAYDQYTLSYANGVVTVSTAGSDGTDNLTGIELLTRSEEHTSELQSLMRISYAVFCLKKKNRTHIPDCTITEQKTTTRYTQIET